MIDILSKKYNIRKIDEKYCLDDIAMNIIGSKDKYNYLSKIKNKEKIGKKYYISEHDFDEILKNTKSKKARGILEDNKNNINNIKKNNIIDKTEKKLQCVDIKYDNYTFFTVLFNDECWTKAIDVCNYLEYDTCSRALEQHVEIEDKMTLKQLISYMTLTINQDNTENNISDLKSLNQNIIFINNFGLYDLCVLSKKPNAKKFKKWITHEVLPSIESTGKYELKKDQKIPIPYLSKHDIDINDHINAKCVYIIHVKDNVYKFGITADILERITAHQKNYDYDDITEIFQLDTIDDCKFIEDKIKAFCKQNKILCSEETQKKMFGGKYSKKSVEMFNTDEKFTINNMMDKIKNYIDELHNEKLKNGSDNEKSLFDPRNIDIMLKHKDIPMEVKIKLVELRKELEIAKLQINTSPDQPIKKKQCVEEIEHAPKKVNKKTNITDLFIDEASSKLITKSTQKVQDDTDSENEQIIIHTCLDCDTKIKKKAKRCIECYNAYLINHANERETCPDCGGKKHKESTKCKECARKFKCPDAKKKKICPDCGEPKKSSSLRCNNCARTHILKENIKNTGRPSYLTLKNAVEKTSYAATGKKYGVCDNTIRKWISKYEKISETDK